MVQTVTVQDQREHLNTLYYGDGGTGKTTDLAFLANLGRTLYIDAESGIKRSPLERLGVNVSNLELLKVDEGLNFDVLEEAFWSIKRDLDNDPESWAGVVWDSGTEIYHALIDALVGRRVDKAERLQKQGRNVAEVMTNRFFVDRDDYGVMSEQVRFLLRRFRDLPCHFGIAFLERRDQDSSDGKVRIGPAITPGLQSDVIGWHDIVCRTSYDGRHYLGATRPEGVRQGKDRYGLLPESMVDPTIERMAGYIAGTISEDKDPLQIELRKEAAKKSKEPDDGQDADAAARAAARASRATTTAKSEKQEGTQVATAK
jgi:hypothetical protein